MADVNLKLDFHYDAGGNVLYIAIDQPRPAIGYELDDRSDMVVVRCDNDGRVVGWTIIGLGEGEPFHVLPLAIDTKAELLSLPRNATTLILEADPKHSRIRLSWGRQYQKVSSPVLDVPLTDRVETVVSAA